MQKQQFNERIEDNGHTMHHSNFKQYDMWYVFQEIIRSDSIRSDVYKGDLIISVSYKSPEKCLNKYGELHLMVKQAKNLLASVPSGTVDAFAKM